MYISTIWILNSKPDTPLEGYFARRFEVHISCQYPKFKVITDIIKSGYYVKKILIETTVNSYSSNDICYYYAEGKNGCNSKLLLERTQ